MVGTDYKGERVAVVGMGKTNISLARYLARLGAKVTCYDRKEKEDLRDVFITLDGFPDIQWSLGQDYLKSLSNFKYIFLTPGMKKDLPEIEEARKKGSHISMEIPLLLERLQAPVIGVTGSAGKTTTATLVGAMLRESLPYKSVYVGGNIGSVLIEEVDHIPKDAVVVLELSSFQLELLENSPPVSTVLNVQPNHLDVHGSYEEYVRAKKRIFEFQRPGDWCVFNLDDDVSREFSRSCPGHKAFFSLRSGEAMRVHEEEGLPVAYLRGDDLVVLGDTDIMPGLLDYPSPTLLEKRDRLLIPGLHNVANALAASLLALLMGGNPHGIRKVLRTFRGVEHRIEFVREIHGVKFYNDSIATSPDRTLALLEAIPGDLILIVGGYDKGIPFDGLAKRVVSRVKGVVTLGKTAPLIEEAIEKAKVQGNWVSPRVVRAQNLEEAVHVAFEMAGGDKCSVALSPACASYDMFRNFEERGQMFRELVKSLK
jgi:UDP-N-acetylmuramoylalanine--D-glutamate ligase